MRSIQLGLALSFLPALTITDAAVAQCTSPSPTAYSEVVAPGCAAPVLVLTSPPHFNTVTTLVATNLPPNPFGVEVVVFAFRLPPVTWPTWTTDVNGFPLAAGCFNHIPDATDYFVSIGTQGSAGVALAIPASGLPAGYTLGAQAFPLDLGTFSFAASTNSVCLYLAP